MDAYEEILRSLGRIEGRLIELGNLSQRISKVEACHAWLKGVFVALIAAFAFVAKAAYAH